jgi:hypothetical protein
MTITETLPASVRVVGFQSEMTIQALVTVLANHVFLTGTLSVLVTLEIVWSGTQH